MEQNRCVVQCILSLHYYHYAPPPTLHSLCNTKLCARIKLSALRTARRRSIGEAVGGGSGHRVLQGVSLVCEPPCLGIRLPKGCQIAAYFPDRSHVREQMRHPVSPAWSQLMQLYPPWDDTHNNQKVMYVPYLIKRRGMKMG